MSTTFNFEELDGATHNYLLAVRESEGRGAPGVFAFSINAPQWADHATAERFVGLPGESSVRIYDTPQPVPNTAFFQGMIENSDPMIHRG